MKTTSESVASPEQPNLAGPGAAVTALMRKAGANPDLDVDSFARTVSNAFHEVQAETYDESIAPQIRNAVTPLLGDLLRDVALPAPFSMLDLGCGTGFAAEALLDRFGPSIGTLHCADISEAMLQRCRARLSAHPAAVRITYGLEAAEELVGRRVQFDLVTTCSVLHHIMDLDRFFSALVGLVRPGGYYLALHEPSQRFAHNADCVELARRYRRQVKMRRWLRPAALWAGIRKAAMRPKSFASQVNRLLLERGVISRPLLWFELASLVDIHDPAIPPALRLGHEGFDPSALLNVTPGLLPVCWKSYSFLGDVDGSDASTQWKRRAAVLAARYPQDGANFAVVWQREAGAKR